MSELSLLELHSCRVLSRPSRLVALVEWRETTARALVANTGRLEGVLEPGRLALCSPSSGELGLRLVAVELEGGWSIVDTMAHERALERAISSKLIPWLSDCSLRRRKPRLYGSTLDFELSCGESLAYLEAKSALALAGETAAYPDAPTERGLRHVLTLLEIAKRGFRAILVLVASHPRVRRAGFYCSRFPEIASAVRRAVESGVELRATNLVLNLEENSLRVDSVSALADCVL
ncbi:MAG: DNA/RNA nuclease SfsA [Acidilobaceae archaeon]